MQQPELKKFNSFEKARRYINELGYTLKHSNQYQEDKSFIYQHKRTKKHIYMRSTFDYLDDNTIDMGTVWTVKNLQQL